MSIIHSIFIKLSFSIIIRSHCVKEHINKIVYKNRAGSITRMAFAKRYNIWLLSGTRVSHLSPDLHI